MKTENDRPFVCLAKFNACFNERLVQSEPLALPRSQEKVKELVMVLIMS